MKVKVKEIVYKEKRVNPDELMPLSEAAKFLGITMPAVIRATERGALTEVINEDASYHFRRLVFRKEVEEFDKERKKKARKKKRSP